MITRREIFEKTLFILVTSIVCFSALVLADYHDVTILFDGNEYHSKSLAPSDSGILSECGLIVNDDDLIYHHENGRDLELVVYKAHNVTFLDGNGEEFSLRVAGSVSDGLDKAGIVLGENDIIDATPSDIVTEDMTITITRDCKILLKVDGERHYCSSEHGTVEKLLEANNITLGKHDKVNFALSKKLKDGMTIVVQRISYKTVSVEKAVKYKTVIEEDDTINNGETVVVQEGINGVRLVTQKQTIVDGEVVKTKTVSSKVKTKAVDQIIHKGTRAQIDNGGQSKDTDTTFTYQNVENNAVQSSDTISELVPEKIIELDSKGKPLHYSKMIIGEATAYSSGTTCSTGVAAIPGRVAVDPKEIPYGTKMYIVSVDGKYNYGYAVAADTGGFIYTSDTVVDLRFNSESDCVNFGRRNVEIYFLDD